MVGVMWDIEVDNIDITIIEKASLYQRSFFNYCSSIDFCITTRSWPSLYTLNSFLAIGEDGSTDGKRIEWIPFELTQQEYDYLTRIIITPEEYNIDTLSLEWAAWFNAIKYKNI